MEEDGYSMEWVLAKRKHEVAAHAVRATRLRSDGCTAGQPTPSERERRYCWQQIGDIAATAADAMGCALATGLTLAGAARIGKD